MRQIALGALQFHDSHGTLPMGQQTGDQKMPYHTWLGSLLPYIEQLSMSVQIAEAYKSSPDPFQNAAHWHFATPVSMFVCPEDSRPLTSQISRGNHVALTSYIGIAGNESRLNNGTLFVNSKVRMSQVTRGLSNVIFISERPPSPDMYFGWWYAGYTNQQSGGYDAILNTTEIVQFNAGHLGGDCDKAVVYFKKSNFRDYCGSLHIWSPHPRGANFAKLDGSVSFITYDGPDIVNALASIR
jgi:prepilin-type processing-associated H-X9-DG protein